MWPLTRSHSSKARTNFRFAEVSVVGSHLIDVTAPTRATPPPDHSVPVPTTRVVMTTIGVNAIA